MTKAPGLYFDGVTSTRHNVTVESTPTSLHILHADGSPITEWTYDDLRAQSSPDDVMRLGHTGGPELARLEIRDTSLIAEIDARAERLDRKGPTERRMRNRVVAWSIAATMSLVLVTLFGVPALTARIAPLIPLSVERRLGAAIDTQLRSMLETGNSNKPFECGTTDSEKPGRAALDTLIGKLETGSGLPIPLKAAVVRRHEANAVALPGGHIYVFEGLAMQARNPDELAGVVAHEIGHVAHRDGTRSLLQAAGLSFMFGMLLGDFTGGGLAVLAAKSVVQSAYSREVEAAADLYGVGLMSRIGEDAHSFAAILDRIAGAIEPGVKILADHPATKERVAAINAAAAATVATLTPLLTPPEWTALKKICG